MYFTLHIYSDKDLIFRTSSAVITRSVNGMAIIRRNIDRLRMISYDL